MTQGVWGPTGSLDRGGVGEGALEFGKESGERAEGARMRGAGDEASAAPRSFFCEAPRSFFCGSHGSSTFWVADGHICATVGS